MTEPRLTPDEAGRCMALDGDWTVQHMPQLGRIMARYCSPAAAAEQRWSAAGIGRIDTLGARLLLDLIAGKLDRIDDLKPAHRRLLEAVAQVETAPDTTEKSGRGPNWLARLGALVLGLWANFVGLVGLLGLLLTTLPRWLLNPRRWRPTALTVQVQQTGLDAVPIIVLLTFMVGAVVAFLGATILKEFGAVLYTVDLVAFSFLREFGVLLVAIMVAGRSGSAFTAQLGSMKAREEVDAIRTLGMDPMDVLVMPRVMALVIVLPLLTVLAMLSGILGGASVSALMLDISPAMYFSRIQDALELRHFWVGLSKAPILAVVIALIGCAEGFKVSGSSESVGRHTTSSVVQSIFAVIFIDALAAVFFMEMGW